MGGPLSVDYARTSDGLDIAYSTSGAGPRDVVLVHGFTTHLDFLADSPWHSYWTDRLAERFRVIQFDKRGTGLSDRSLGHGSIEDRMRDVLAVMDAAGSSKASIVGVSEGGPIGVTFAATYPERVERLGLYGTFARLRRAPDFPEGIADELADQFVAWVEGAWGSGEVFGTFLITHSPDPEAAVRTMARFERNACTRQMAATILRFNLDIDVRPLLGGVTAPTLVMHNRGDPLIPVEVARSLAERIVGAEYVEQPDDYHCTWVGDEFRPLMDRLLEFLDDTTVPTPSVVADRTSRSVATILFTDIVGSTELASTMGDEPWAALLDTHHRRAVEATRRRGGTVVKTTGDGVLALFDGPSRAIWAVHDLRREIASLGLQIRAGIHTGEIERSKRDVAGIGVHIAARVQALASPGEILASRTVRDIAAGSGIQFVERGIYQLKGVPDAWQLFTVGEASAI